MKPLMAWFRNRRDRRPFAIALTVVLVALGGWALTAWNGGDAPSAREHARQQIDAEVKRRFDEGVVMLHARQYEHAMTAFHRVLQLKPALPEAHVNAGFALIGMQRFKEARDFFDAAIDLRKEQTNAYYGLAEALEGLGDLQGALGAMESYVHLAKADDPFRPKAEAAIWEWRAALAKRGGGAAAARRP
jgi:tetratricopeptide (TPR) repeat protein